jgi:hypothetical protein
MRRFADIASADARLPCYGDVFIVAEAHDSFTEPPEQIRKEIAALKADKTVPEAEKKQDLAEFEAALKIAKPIQFKENIALVLKCFDKLLAPQPPSLAACGCTRSNTTVRVVARKDGDRVRLYSA